MELDGIRDLIFSDRYALKEPDRSKLKVGDKVVVVVSTEGEWEQRSVAKVLDVDHKEKKALLKLADTEEEITRPFSVIDKCLETEPSQMWDRMAKWLPIKTEEPELVEKYQKEYRWLLDDFRFLPGGRINASLGSEELKNLTNSVPDEFNGFASTLMNCFAVDMKPEDAKFGRDSRESIMDTMKELVSIQSLGGGVGIPLSALRPNNAYIQGVNGRSSGAVSWGSLYSEATSKISAGGSRRGALLLGIHCHHPDVVEFIFSKVRKSEISAIKEKWQTKFPKANFVAHGIENANISVFITDEFMEAVKNDDDWDLVFPDYELAGKEIYNRDWDGDIKSWRKKNLPIKVYDTVKARDLWDCICESAWMSAEPGIIFIDRMNNEHNGWYYSRIIGTNPCLHKDSYLVTDNGLEKISKLKSKIWNGEQFSESRSWMTGIKPVCAIRTNSGFEYITTLDHKFQLKNEGWCEAQNLKNKQIKFEVKEHDWLGFNPHPDVNYEVLGFIFGDGCWHTASNRMTWVYATPKLDDEVASLIEDVFCDEFAYDRDGKWFIKVPLGSVYANAFTGRIEDRLIPDWIMQLPKEDMRKFLRGLLSANGSNLAKYRKIQLVSINKEMLQQVQQMLMLFGIKAKLWVHDKSQDVEFSNGVYACKKSYHLVLSRKSYEKYMKEIGFIQSYKNEFIDDGKYKNELLYETVNDITIIGEAEVWDFNEPELHKGVTNGAFVHNCGEIPLPDSGVCLLGHLNLPMFVNGTIGEGKINWEELKKAIRLGVRFLDDVADYNPYHDPRIKEIQMRDRRIGLGTLGLGEALIRMGVSYGEKSVPVVEEIYKFIAIEAYKASIDLAEEKGSFPAFRYDKYVQSGFMKRLFPELPREYQKKLSKNGIRNVCLLTAAPTGSGGTMVGTSTGIEPYFAFSYWRSGRLGTREIKERIVQQYLEENNINEDVILPDYFVTAGDITPEDHIMVQVTIQKWLDQSISKTNNLPESASIADVQRLYELAHAYGAKGTTIYRSGSRDSQVLSIKNEDEQEVNTIPDVTSIELKPTHRPNVVYGRTEKISMPDGKLYITTNSTDEDGVVEVFIHGGEGNTEISALCNYIGRLISVMRKYNVPLREIVSQGNKVPGGIPFWYKGELDEKGHLLKNIPCTISHVLARYEENPVRTNVGTSGAKCPSCKEPLRLEEGCSHCPSCGYSQCG